MNKTNVFGCLAILCILLGCSGFPETRTAENPGLPTPTNFSLFKMTNVPKSATDIVQSEGGKPTVAQFFSQQPTGTAMVIPTSVPLIEVTSTQLPSSQLITSTVYADRINPNWSLVADPEMHVDPANTTHAHSGTASIAMSPKSDFSKLSFVVNQKSDQAYLQDQVISISFWLNSGNNTVILSDLFVNVLGSNAYPYYVENDNSVPTDVDIDLQETRLYFLGLNRAIPPETWVQVIANLDNLTHEPVYKYVTGFYIKNDAGFLRTVYIDDIEVSMIENGGQPAPTVLSETTATPTTKTGTEPTPTVSDIKVPMK